MKAWPHPFHLPPRPASQPHCLIYPNHAFAQAFGAIASLEGAYFRDTGKQLLMSEQFLMDCGWSTGNTACMGGYQDLAFQWVLAEGGIPSEDEYPYQGVTSYCRKDAPLAAKFQVGLCKDRKMEEMGRTKESEPGGVCAHARVCLCTRVRLHACSCVCMTHACSRHVYPCAR